MKDVFDLTARVLIAAYFFYDAFDIGSHVKDVQEALEIYDVAWASPFFIISTVVILVLGGLMILTGYRTTLGATLILLYWLPMTFVVYSFWDDNELFKRISGLHFAKNLAIAGALFHIIAHEPGKYSIRRLLKPL